MPKPPAILPGLLAAPDASAQTFAQAHSALAAWIRRRLADLTGDPHTAEDLAQQTWQAVWESVSQGRYDPARSALSTYAYAVSQNVYRHWLRRQSTAAAHAPAIAASAPLRVGEDDPPADPLADAELIDELRRVIREGAPGLGDDTLRTLRLIAQNATDRELAVELAVAPSTAHARKRAALDALRTHLTNRFFTERGTVQRQQP